MHHFQPRETRHEFLFQLLRDTRRWVVVLSKAAGAPAAGAVRREAEAAELEALKSHPAVKALLEVFPEAKIAEIRRLTAIDTDIDDESAAG